MDVLPRDRWEILKENFLKRHLDFQDFSQPGRSFIEAVLGERRATLRRFDELGLRERIPALVEAGEGLKALAELKRADFLALISNYVWGIQFGSTDASVCAVLGGLLETVKSPYVGPESLAPLFEGMASAGMKVDSEWDINALLWAFRPTDYFPIRIKLYRDFSELLGRPLLRHRRFSPEHYAPVRELMEAFRQAMAEWQPRDMTDVQSVFWDMTVNEVDANETEEVTELAAVAQALPAGVASSPQGRRAWVIAPGQNARYWEVWQRSGHMSLGWDVGDAAQFTTKAAVRDALVEATGEAGMNAVMAIYQFANEVRPGDLVFAKKGRSRLVGWGVVTSEYRYVSPPGPGEDPHQLAVEWRSNAEHALPPEMMMPTKTLTEIRPADALMTVARSLYALEPAAPAPPPLASYTKAQALQDLFMPEALLDKMVTQLQRRKNVVLQGPPGVGKTFVARRLAYLIMGVKDPDRVRMVQFHQSYSYEDFIQGFRPCEDGTFRLRKGHFYDFCQRAAVDEDHDYFFIIDEINRGNLSKIFGELLVLLEHDKRGPEHALGLAYSGDDDAPELFHVPENVHVIGTMNTADKSLALVDFAMRRRFAFVALPPQFGAGFQEWLVEGCGAPGEFVSRLVRRVGELNEAISQDRQVGPGCCIGHSFFTADPESPPADWGRWLEDIVQGEIEPLLLEYWPDDAGRATEEASRLLQ